MGPLIALAGTLGCWSMFGRHEVKRNVRSCWISLVVADRRLVFGKGSRCGSWRCQLCRLDPVCRHLFFQNCQLEDVCDTWGQETEATWQTGVARAHGVHLWEHAWAGEEVLWGQPQPCWLPLCPLELVRCFGSCSAQQCCLDELSIRSKLSVFFPAAFAVPAVPAILPSRN